MDNKYTNSIIYQIACEEAREYDPYWRPLPEIAYGLKTGLEKDNIVYFDEYGCPSQFLEKAGLEGLFTSLCDIEENSSDDQCERCWEKALQIRICKT